MKYILQFTPKLLIHETVLFAPASIYGSIEKHHFCKFLIFDLKKKWEPSPDISSMEEFLIQQI